MDWDRLIPGHPHGGGCLGSKEDGRGLKQFMTDSEDGRMHTEAA